MSALPKAVLWDWDGTLADTLPFIRKANDHVRQHFGMPPMTDEEFHQMLAHSTREGFAKIYGDRAEEAKTVIYDFVTGNHTDNLNAIDGAQDILSFFHDREIPMGIVSNKRQEILDEQIVYFGWQHYFQFALGPGSTEKDKPAPDPLLLGRDRLNPAMNMEDIWYIGDSVTDAKAANAAGCPLILLDLDGTLQPKVEDYSVHLRVENYNVLHEFLLQNDRK